jgi:hypothetical protein
MDSINLFENTVARQEETGYLLFFVMHDGSQAFKIITTDQMAILI